jgi:hypothetical protein
MTTDDCNDATDQEAELARLEAEFEAAGGRGVDLAEAIDALRLNLHPEDYPELVAAAAEAAAEEDYEDYTEDDSEDES